MLMFSFIHNFIKSILLKKFYLAGFQFNCSNCFSAG